MWKDIKWQFLLRKYRRHRNMGHPEDHGYTWCRECKEYIDKLLQEDLPKAHVLKWPSIRDAR